MSTASPDGAICPSCGRSLGPLEQCPDCGAFLHKRRPRRTLLLVLIPIALVGIAAFVYAMRGWAAPRVSIAGVTTTMNNSRVRLEGIVTRGPILYAETQELHFYLADPTGEILVSSFRPTTRQLLEQRKIPAPGDRAAIEGMLEVRDDFVSLDLASADKLELTRSAAQPITLASADGSTKLNASPAPATPIPPGALDDTQKGNTPRPPAALTPAPATRTPTAAAVQRAIGSLSAADQDAPVTVSGRIAATSGFSKGMLYTLDDGTGTVTLLLWSDVLGSYKDAAALVVGARVQARGKVNLYNNALEVEPAKGGDLTLLAPSLEPTPAPRAIDGLTTNLVGTEVAVEGTVTKIAPFSKGKYVTVRDDSGEIRVTIFSNVLDTMVGKEKLVVGAQVAVKAKLNLYNGELELVPEQGGVVIE